MVIAVRVVRELQARVAPVERILDRPLLLACGRQPGVGTGAQHVAAVVVHRLRRMLTGRTSAAVAGTAAGAAVSRASFYAYHHNPLRQTNANTTHQYSRSSGRGIGAIDVYYFILPPQRVKVQRKIHEYMNI